MCLSSLTLSYFLCMDSFSLIASFFIKHSYVWISELGASCLRFASLDGVFLEGVTFGCFYLLACWAKFTPNISSLWDLIWFLTLSLCCCLFLPFGFCFFLSGGSFLSGVHLAASFATWRVLGCGSFPLFTVIGCDSSC